MQEKIYVGSGKEVETKFGVLTKLSFSRKDLDTMISNLNEKGYVNLNLQDRKEVGKYGETKYMTIDNWKPELTENVRNVTQKDDNRYPIQRNKEETININDIPF